MKKLYFILGCIFLLALNVNAQRDKRGEANAMTVDTVKGAETVNFAATVKLEEGYLLTMTALCTELGGTSDGTIWAEGSIDGTNYIKLTWQQDMVQYYARDTSEVARQGSEIGVVDAQVAGVQIYNAGFLYYRWASAGTSGDTTIMTPYYTIKKR